MNAKEANELALEKSLLSIEPQVKSILNTIKDMAQLGKFEVVHPWDGLSLSSRQKYAVATRLTSMGYRVVEHPDPDPGHPCSRPYTTIEWGN